MGRETRDARAALGELLRAYRRTRRWTQEVLAERSGVSPAAVSLLERGRVGPRFGTVSKLADTLGLTLDERAALEALAEASGDEPTLAGTSEAPAPRGGLRRKASSFVGREREVAQVRHRLTEHRLVTLTGPGGVGKTRLAVEAAHDLAETGQYPDGTWLVDLAVLADPALVPHAVAAAAGMELDPDGSPVDALAYALQSRRLLLVLDNCEHVVDACAGVAEALLGGCPDVRLLATSRESLGVDGEVVIRVPSLALPSAGGAASLAEIGGASAVRLFIDRAMEVAPGFALTGHNAAVVAEVCRRLDGIPLALEFAAKLLRALPVEEVAARMDDRFRLLTGGRRTALRRQQTLRALVDWSYDLLAPAERALFVRLSVFAGTFTLEAAEAVGGEPIPGDAGAGDLSSAETLALLLRLVDTSFIFTDVDTDRDDGPVTARFRLLETLREYGRERLFSTGEAARVQRLHLGYYLGLVEAATKPDPSQQIQALQQLDGERENVWAALRWMRDHDDAEADRRLAAALTVLSERLTTPTVRHALAPLLSELRRLQLPAYVTLGRQLLEQTSPEALEAGADLYWIVGDHDAEAAAVRRLQEVKQDPAATIRAQVRYARVLLLQGRIEEALALLDAAARTAVELQDDLLLLDVRLEQGYAHTHTADCVRGRSAYDDALVVLERLRPQLPDALYWEKRLITVRGRGFVAHNADENEACAAYHQEAHDLAEEQGDGPEVARALLNLADGLWGCWRHGQALATYDRALRAATAAGYTLVRGSCLVGRGIVLWSAGRYQEAVRDLQEGLDVVREDGSGWWIAYGLAYLSALRASLGELSAALDASREALVLAQQFGAGYPLALAQMYVLWQQEVLAPGHPAHAAPIADTLREVERLGLEGLAVHLRWVSLLHQVADPAITDEVLASSLATEVRALHVHAPTKGTVELLVLQVTRALGAHRPNANPADLVALIEWVTTQKAAALDPSVQQGYRDTRQPWSIARPQNTLGAWR